MASPTTATPTVMCGSEYTDQTPVSTSPDARLRRQVVTMASGNAARTPVRAAPTDTPTDLVASETIPPTDAPESNPRVSQKIRTETGITSAATA